MYLILSFNHISLTVCSYNILEPQAEEFGELFVEVTITLLEKPLISNLDFLLYFQILKILKLIPIDSKTCHFLHEMALSRNIFFLHSYNKSLAGNA